MDGRATILSAWRTSNRITIGLVRQIPPALWNAAVPGAPRRTVRMIAAHLHNSRCSWIRTLGREHGVRTPLRVDRRKVSRAQLAAAQRLPRQAIDRLWWWQSRVG
jgi:hypothetical protein